MEKPHQVWRDTTKTYSFVVTGKLGKTFMKLSAFIDFQVFFRIFKFHKNRNETDDTRGKKNNVIRIVCVLQLFFSVYCFFPVVTHSCPYKKKNVNFFLGGHNFLPNSHTRKHFQWFLKQIIKYSNYYILIFKLFFFNLIGHIKT